MKSKNSKWWYIYSLPFEETWWLFSFNMVANMLQKSLFALCFRFMLKEFLFLLSIFISILFDFKIYAITICINLVIANLIIISYIWHRYNVVFCYIYIYISEIAVHDKCYVSHCFYFSLIFYCYFLAWATKNPF